ncbi:hypothetical protein OIO90_001595 [Microbotryomycetes sp. JL221]|nr:hypothetical protein OIO90_001595 [Microbotryomycetes sp. JL221]
MLDGFSLDSGARAALNGLATGNYLTIHKNDLVEHYTSTSPHMSTVPVSTVPSTSVVVNGAFVDLDHRFLAPVHDPSSIVSNSSASSTQSSMVLSNLFGHADSAPASPLDAGPLSAPLPEPKANEDDFLGFPFDLMSVSAISNPSQFELPVSTATTFAAVPRMLDSIALDHKLESPLGLDDSPLSEFFASPMFEEESESDVPPLVYGSLFPSSTSTTAATPSIAGLSLLPSTLTASSRAAPAFVSPALLPLHSSVPPTPVLSPAVTHISIGSTATSSVQSVQEESQIKKARQATGFRGHDTALTPLDAPIQPRQYMVPSTTSRKRKTVAVEREMAKRSRGAVRDDSIVAATSSEGDAAASTEDIPSDLVAAVERKRLQNTLSARKSRARKQERLAELEDRNHALESENQALKARVQQLESMLNMSATM